MKGDEFHALFVEHVAAPLAAAGFYMKGRSLYYRDDEALLALLRCSGRAVLPGNVTLFVGFRHTFLRDMTTRGPAADLPDNPFDYPVKLGLKRLLSGNPRWWWYRPHNRRVEYDRIEFGSWDTSEAIEKLRDLKCQLERQTPRWVAHLSPDRLARHIRRFGEGAYCERLWLEDYGSHAAT